MKLRTILCIAIAVFSLAFLGGCGSSGAPAGETQAQAQTLYEHFLGVKIDGSKSEMMTAMGDAYRPKEGREKTLGATPCIEYFSHDVETNDMALFFVSKADNKVLAKILIDGPILDGKPLEKPVTFETFENISEGMTLEKVSQTFGGEGLLFQEIHLVDPTPTQSYFWFNPDGGKIVVNFQGGKVISFNFDKLTDRQGKVHTGNIPGKTAVNEK